MLEYFEGSNLEDFVEMNRPLSAHQILTICQQLLSVLDHLRENQVVHSDLKPSNVLISTTVDMRIKVIDFGCSLRLPLSRTKHHWPIWGPVTTHIQQYGTIQSENGLDFDVIYGHLAVLFIG